MSTLAEQTIEVLKTEFDEVYQAGYDKGKAGSVDLSQYLTTLNGVFKKAVFPSGSDIELNVNHMIENVASAIFLSATGLSSITLNILECDNDAGMLYTNAFNGNTTCTKITLLGYASKPSNITQWMSSCGALEEIVGELDFTNCTSTLYAFSGVSNLKRIQIKPNTISVAISFQVQANLDDESIQSIVDGLADLTGQTAQKLTLHSSIVSKLTDEQKLQILLKNWVLG